MAVLFAILLLFTAPLAQGQSTAVITVQADQPGAVVSSNLFGIFFEEINFAGEGGLYAEMVQNRGFHSDWEGEPPWDLIRRGNAVASRAAMVRSARRTSEERGR